MLPVEVRSAMALLDAVFHVATRAVEALIEPAGGNLGRLQGGDDEARVGLVAQPLRLGDHAPPPRPALERRPAEVLVAPGRPRRLAASSAHSISREICLARRAF